LYGFLFKYRGGQETKHFRLHSRGAASSCTMRLWPDSNANFSPEHIGRFKVQNSECLGILSGQASVAVFDLDFFASWKGKRISAFF